MVKLDQVNNEDTFSTLQTQRHPVDQMIHDFSVTDSIDLEQIGINLEIMSWKGSCSWIKAERTHKAICRM